MQEFWAGKRIVIGVCGGIAAYKICQLVSTLAKAGAEVRVILTQSAAEFVTPLTFATLSRHAAYTDADFWHRSAGRPLHIQLAEWADAIAIAPLTANTLAKLAYGLADNLLTNLLLASNCPVLLAPAMNTQMWEQVSVQRNWEQVLSNSRYWSMTPGEGRLACDAEGMGRLPEPEAISTQLLAILWAKGIADWRGKRVLVSGGGTREFLDAVRFIGNPSTGRMGWAIARAAADRGAQVTFVHAPLTLGDGELLDGIETVAVTSAEDMQARMDERFGQADVTVMSAAVGDVRPEIRVSGKVPKAELPESLPLAEIPDIVRSLCDRKSSQQRVIGFAAQVGELVPAALAKLERKGLDAIVANAIDRQDSGFASGFNQATVLGRNGQRLEIPHCSKLEMAHHVLDFAKTL
ncbi:MAG: bifunctional phosphopantothenoylcysteine decarboxylase/phosphopantothenate--cysteine ligase CoaBC [Cyanobacteria bacterium P01_A01_bin.3]